MWDDVTIGDGEMVPCALNLLRVDGIEISHNSGSYWISGCILNIGMRIYKDTNEGKTLKMLIDDESRYAEIKPWLDCIAVKKLPSEKLIDRIDSHLERAFQDGRRDKASEIRSVLMCG
jgi:hypothetical protein